MPRPSQIDEQRKELLPIVCQVFSELGYRRTTTAELAKRCGVRENILYRLWEDKKAMFLAAIDDIFERRAEKWAETLPTIPVRNRPGAISRLRGQAPRGIRFLSSCFHGLSESDDTEIRAASTGCIAVFTNS